MLTLTDKPVANLLTSENRLTLKGTTFSNKYGEPIFTTPSNVAIYKYSLLGAILVGYIGYSYTEIQLQIQKTVRVICRNKLWVDRVPDWAKPSEILECWYDHPKTTWEEIQTVIRRAEI